MEIKASCVYNLEVIRDFCYLDVKTGNSPKKKVECLLMLAATVIVLAVFVIILFDYDIFMWMLIALTVLAVFLNCYLYFWLPKARYKTERNRGENTNTFLFYDDGFEGFLTEKGFTGSAQIKYDTLYKIIENKKYFIIFESKKRAHMIDKSTIDPEELAQLKRKLFDVMPREKYIIRTDW